MTTAQFLATTLGWLAAHWFNLATVGLACAALIVSLVSLRRSRIGQPHWTATEPPYPNGADALWASIRNRGPGEAEQLTYRVKRPGDDWQDEFATAGMRAAEAVVGRHKNLTVQLFGRVPDGSADPIPQGRYLVRLYWRALPDTNKKRSKRFTFVYWV